MSYTPKTWVDGEVIYHQDLNRMEQGIQTALSGEAKVLFVETNPITGFPDITNPISNVIYACLKLPQEQTSINSLYNFWTYKGVWQNISQGPKGDGNFTFIKYSEGQPASDLDIHNEFSPSTDKYIGFYNGTSSVAPSDHNEYTWCKFIGTSPVITIESIPEGHRVTITDEANPNGQSFIILDGADAVSPFKGWLDSTDKLPANPHVGDYAYVKNNGTTYVYRCTDEGLWPSNSDEEKEPSDATFASTQLLNNVKIDDTHLSNPIGSDETNNPTLPKAEDVMPMKFMLDGVTFKEEKLTNYTPTSGSWKIDGGTLSSDNYSKAEVGIPQGTKKIRFSGFLLRSGLAPIQVGFLLGHYNNGNWVTDYAEAYGPNSEDETVLHEFNTIVPEGATHFRFDCRYGITTMPESKFYCYFQRGKTVVEMIPEVADNFTTDDATKSLSAKAGKEFHEEVYGFDTIYWGDNQIPYPQTDNTPNTVWAFATRTNNMSDLAVKRMPNGNVNSYIRSVTNYRGKRAKIVRKDGSQYACYYAFFKRPITTSNAPKTDMTLQDLVEYGYLSDAHYNSELGTYTNLFIIGYTTPEAIIDIPEDATYIYFVGRLYDTSTSQLEVTPTITNYVRFPESFNIEVIEHTNGSVDDLQESVEKLENKVDSESFVLLAQISESGEISPSNNHVITNLIPLDKGFYISVHDGYKIDGITLHNVYGTMVGYNVRGKDIRYSNYGTMVITPNYYMRIQIGRYSENNELMQIDNLGNIIKEYMQIDDRLHVIMPESIDAISVYPLYKKKLKSITNLCWHNDGRIYGVKANSGTFFEDFYLPNQTWRGVIYGANEEYNKYIGQHVSLRTYLTSLLNPRSVMYTERIVPGDNPDSNSKYGYTYHSESNLVGPFYGLVCTGLTSYLANMSRVYYSMHWDSGKIPGMEVVARGNREHPNGWQGTSYNVANEIGDIVEFVQPMDFMWKDGHCFTISDILVDSEGNRVFIIVSEETVPTALQTIYTPDTFRERLASYTVEGSYQETWRVLRYNAWRNDPGLQYTIDDTELELVCTQPYLQFSPKQIRIDDDITTFKGEYCAVAINGTNDPSIDSYNDFKLYLNVKRNNKYTEVQIYEEDADVDDVNVTPTYIDISDTSTYPPDNILDSNEEDWIVVDVMDEDLPAGKYKARVIDDENNTSGFTHFELISVSLQSRPNSENSNKTDFVFGTSNNCVPYLIEMESINGAYKLDRRWDINQDDITNGYKTVDYKYSSDEGLKKYAKLFVKGDYGVVVIRIDLSQQ